MLFLTLPQVSPAFYAWSKHLLLRYRYSSDAAHPVTLDANTMPTTSLAGISLYTPRIEEVSQPNRSARSINVVIHDRGEKSGWKDHFCYLEHPLSFVLSKQSYRTLFSCLFCIPAIRSM